jgi:hypothetical protein
MKPTTMPSTHMTAPTIDPHATSHCHSGPLRRSDVK